MSRLSCGLGALVATMLLSVVAGACPVCFQAQNEENRIAFIVTTVFLSLLPFGLVGGLILWVRRRARQVAAEESVLAGSTRGAGHEGAPSSGHASPAR